MLLYLPARGGTGTHARLPALGADERALEWAAARRARKAPSNLTLVEIKALKQLPILRAALAQGKLKVTSASSNLADAARAA